VASPQRRGTREGQALETIVGIALVVISALEIWFVIRTVQANAR
jgi:hypothetical protein